MAEELVAPQFLELFVQCQRSVYGYILTIVANVHEADEVFQETSLQLWKKRDEYDPELKFLPWACGVARQVARNHRAKKGRDRHSFSESFLEELAVARSERSEWLDAALKLLRECLGRLDDDQRTLLRLRYEGEHTVNQLATQLKCPANTLYQRLHRIRQRLYHCVQVGLRKEASS